MMQQLDEIFKRADAGELTRADLPILLALNTPEDRERLRAAAYAVKLRTVGNRVRLRGLIEVSNRCGKNCYYCGIRRDNREPERFTLSVEAVRAAAREAHAFGYGSVVLQSGERSDRAFVDFIGSCVRAIKQDSGGALGITLSCGEQTPGTYAEWFAAGAHRYLLRIEASDPAFYRVLHPADHSYERRVECLRDLRRCGYQVGTGVMIGLPGQTPEHLTRDLEFFRDLDVDMIGMGPYLPHHGTPLGRANPGLNAPRQLALGLQMIAVTRLWLRDVNIAATTALQTLAPDGREQGLLAGANVIMPNVGPTVRRADYLLYDGKPGLNENAGDVRARLHAALEAIGEVVESGAWGDSPHFKNRRESAAAPKCP